MDDDLSFEQMIDTMNRAREEIRRLQERVSQQRKQLEELPRLQRIETAAFAYINAVDDVEMQEALGKPANIASAKEFASEKYEELRKSLEV